MEQTKQPDDGMKVVGLNLAILVVYSIICRLLGEGGIIIDALFIVMHVLVCIILAIVQRKWAWLLSAFLVLVIGFSTCAFLGGLVK